MFTLIASALVAQADVRPAKAQLDFKPTGLDWEGTKARNQMFMPHKATVSGDGFTIDLGNGPAKTFKLKVVGDKLFVDLNQNGKFDDDPSVKVLTVNPNEPGGNTSYRATVVFPASYQSGYKTWRADYGLNIYWFNGRNDLFYYRAGLGTGFINLGNRKLAVEIYEDGATGVFGQHFDKAADPTKLTPESLVLQGGRFDPRGTFVLDGVNYLAEISPDGRNLTVSPTYRVVAAPQPPKPATEVKLLADGKKAPDFTVEKFEGGTDKLSAHLGKVVILKFWATWCGPCKASMPHFEEVYAKAKTQGVDLMAVCVADERELFQKWVTANEDKYHFPFSFDSAGRDNDKSISKKLFGVSGIPTVFIIDKEGKVSSSIVGYGGANDHRVEEGLKKLGVNL